MSFDTKYGRYCDGCGKTISKAHRVFESKDYCGTCYARNFTAKPCVHCGAPARMHESALEAPVCRACTYKERVCQRCEKPIVGSAGMISAGKPVCASCAPHFREARPCQRCGKPSSRLSAVPQMGIEEKICDHCRNAVLHKTCSICRKSRKVAGYTDANRPYCAQCVPGQELTHHCPGCQTVLPGAGKAKCRPCTNRERLAKDANMLAAALNHQWAKELCVSFAEWLWERNKESPKIAQIYQQHQPMLQQLDATYRNVEDISEQALLQNFGTAMLRKHLLVRQHLEHAMSLKVTAMARSDCADINRIEKKLAEHGSQPWGRLLSEYAAWLEDAKISVRTRRMYIAAASTFCSELIINQESWREDQAQAYLLRHPGTYTNLLKFVRYCANVRGWNVPRLTMRDPIKLRSKPPTTISRLKRLLDKIQVQGLDDVSTATLCQVLSISFGLSLLQMQAIPSTHFQAESAGLKFKVDHEWVTVPAELLAITKNYLARIA